MLPVLEVGINTSPWVGMCRLASALNDHGSQRRLSRRWPDARPPAASASPPTPCRLAPSRVIVVNHAQQISFASFRRPSMICRLRPICSSKRAGLIARSWMNAF